MAELKYVKGDVREPTEEGNKLLIHCCNDIGVMSGGVALAIRNKWGIVYDEYAKWASDWSASAKVFAVGKIQAVKVEKDLAVINMIGQHKIGFDVAGLPPIRYYGIDECLKQVAVIAKKNNACIVAPRFGSALAGGEWDYIEMMIIKRLIEQDVNVTIYDY